MSSVARSTEPARPAGPWYINRAYLLIWLGGALSFLGDTIFEFTLIVWAAEQFGTSGSWLITGILVASVVPIIVFGPIAGTLVDRWRDKVAVIVRSSVLIAVLIFVLIPVVSPGTSLPVPAEAAGLLVIVAIVSALSQFIRPAQSVIVRDVVPDEQRERASALTQVAYGAAIIIGPPLAAPVVISFGAIWALIANGLSFVICALLIRGAAQLAGVREKDHSRPVADEPSSDGTERRLAAGVLAEYRDGLRMFGSSLVLTTIAVALVISMLGAGLLNALDIFFVVHNLGGTESQYGWFGTAQGAGTLAGSLVLGILAVRIGAVRMFSFGLLLIGLTIFGYARMQNLPGGLVMIFLIGAVIPSVEVAVSPMIMRVTPRTFMGRVSGTLNPMVSGAMLGGVLIGGPIYGIVGNSFSVGSGWYRVGTIDGLFMVAGVVCLIAGAVALRRLTSGRARDEMARNHDDDGGDDATPDDGRSAVSVDGPARQMRDRMSGDGEPRAGEIRCGEPLAVAIRADDNDGGEERTAENGHATMAAER